MWQRSNLDNFRGKNPHVYALKIVCTRYFLRLFLKFRLSGSIWKGKLPIYKIELKDIPNFGFVNDKGILLFLQQNSFIMVN